MSVTGVCGLRVWVPCVFESSPAKYVPTLLLVGANVKPKMREVRRGPKPPLVGRNIT